MVDLPTLHGPRNSTIGLEVISPSADDRSELTSILTVGDSTHCLQSTLHSPTVSHQLMGFYVDHCAAVSGTFLALQVQKTPEVIVLTCSRSLAHLPAPERGAEWVTTELGAVSCLNLEKNSA